MAKNIPFGNEAREERSALVSSAGVSPALFSSSTQNITVRSRGRLPHWESEGGVYFVTFRLADSLPQKALQQIRFSRRDSPATAAQMRRQTSESERKRLKKLHARRIERFLDAGAGECYLRNPLVAEAVIGALKKFDGDRYRLFAWCLMPNHVHVVFQPFQGHALAAILQAWKSFSGKHANRILRREGEFWQREYYDHLIRNEEEFAHAVRYTLENPSKAGLANWPWAGSCL
jgi:REP element-mobilizing transposase RayT